MEPSRAPCCPHSGAEVARHRRRRRASGSPRAAAGASGSFCRSTRNDASAAFAAELDHVPAGIALRSRCSNDYGLGGQLIFREACARSSTAAQICMATRS